MALLFDKVKTYLKEYDNQNALCHYLKSDLITFQIKEIGIKSEVLTNLIKLLSPVASFLITAYALVFVCIYNLGIILKVLVRKNNVSLVCNNVFLFYTDLLYDRFKVSDIDCEKSIWILGPDINPKEDLVYCSANDLICFRDVFKSTITSIITIIVSFVKRPAAIITTYKCGEYFNHFYMLDRVTKRTNIYFSNQIDKWALLFDTLPASHKTLLQHGVEYDNLVLPHRLKTIDIFYSINSITWKNCYAGILDCEPLLKILKPTIDLTPVTGDKPILMIITNNIFYNIEKEIVDNLQNFKGCIYLKLHPANKTKSLYYDLRDKYHIKLIESQSFPQADIVVSYFSTLAFEYMAHDIPVFIYRNEEDFSLTEVLSFVHNNS